MKLLWTDTPQLPEAPQLPEGADWEAMLTQTRIDLALNEGAASNGHLLRRIASTSPQRTQHKTTRASALAGSPTSTPVKSPKRRGAPSTPQRSSKVTVDGSPISKSRTTAAPVFAMATPAAITSPGANRKAHAWNPTERTPAEAVKNFQVPDLCKGSCVSSAGDNVQRQIGKARGGEFKEEVVLVGMRFVVVG